MDEQDPATGGDLNNSTIDEEKHENTVASDFLSDSESGGENAEDSINNEDSEAVISIEDNLGDGNLQISQVNKETQDLDQDKYHIEDNFGDSNTGEIVQAEIDQNQTNLDIEPEEKEKDSLFLGEEQSLPHESDRKSSSQILQFYQEVEEGDNNKSDDDNDNLIIEQIVQLEKQPEKPPEPQISVEERHEQTAAQLLAERLRQNAARAKPKKTLVLSADLIKKNEGQEPKEKELIVVASRRKQHDLLKEHLKRLHTENIKQEIVEESDQEIQDEEFEEEEEEEEDKPEEKLETPEEQQVAKVLTEELNSIEPNKELDPEEIEKRMYERVVELRLLEDKAEILKIIRIITGQWRSGRLKQGDEGMEKAFEGNEKETKELQGKKKMRQQRRVQKRDEQSRVINSQTIAQWIERASWISAGQREDATTSDVIRGELATMADNDPRRQVLERIEMNTFLKEQRAQASLNERRTMKNHKLKRKDRSESTEMLEKSEMNLNSLDFSKKQNTFFSYIMRDSYEKTPKPKKKISRKVDKASKELEQFLSRMNS